MRLVCFLFILFVCMCCMCCLRAQEKKKSIFSPNGTSLIWNEMKVNIKKKSHLRSHTKTRTLRAFGIIRTYGILCCILYIYLYLYSARSFYFKRNLIFILYKTIFAHKSAHKMNVYVGRDIYITSMLCYVCLISQNVTCKIME